MFITLFVLLMRILGKTSPPTPKETSQPTPNQTSQPFPEETSQPTTIETSQPTPEETSPPTLKETSQATQNQTSQPTPEETSPPTPDETSQPTTDKISQPTPKETSQPTPKETSQRTPNQTSQPPSEETSQPTPIETSQPTQEDFSQPISEESLLPRNVTTIIKDLPPRLETYLDKLLKFMPVLVRQVHESSTYEPLVLRKLAFCHMGVFYDYLIRKEIHNLLGLEDEVIDRRASRGEEILADDNLLFDAIKNSEGVTVNGVEMDLQNDDEVKKLVDAIKKPYLKPVASYQKYKDPKNATLDIIEDIFNTSMLHLLFFGEAIISYDPNLVNMDNIRAVVKHVGTWDRNNILLNPGVGGEYFCGDADLIIDDILVEIKVSMHHFRIKHIKSRRHLYQMILYALGVYINEGKEIRKFKIYNPLKGIEYYFEIAQLDFVEFLKLVDEIKPL